MKKLFLVAASIAIISCSDRAEYVSQENSVLKVNPTKVERRKPGYIFIGIFEVTIHRASRNCTSGFGFCDFEWFPDINPPVIPPFTFPDLGDVGGRRTVDVHKDGNGRYFFDVDATTAVEEAPDLIVDQDIMAKKEGEITLIIKAGSYSFDPSIDEFGAYRIYLSHE